MKENPNKLQKLEEKKEKTRTAEKNGGTASME
jgi:hypothetical protein